MKTVNVKNKDQACFVWAVVSAMFSAAKNPQRVGKYSHYPSVLKLKGIQFPMTLRQIPNFEKQKNISVIVYVLKKEQKDYATLPTYLTKSENERHVNLLLIHGRYDALKGPINYHCCWIKNLSRLLSKQLSKEDGWKYFCNKRLHYYHSQENLNNHPMYCRGKADFLVDRCLNYFMTSEELVLIPFIV